MLAPKLSAKEPSHRLQAARLRSPYAIPSRWSTDTLRSLDIEAHTYPHPFTMDAEDSPWGGALLHF